MKCETAVLQDRAELDWFISILKRENVRSYLEIGSKHGGSIWQVANALPKGSRIVSIDLPHGDGSFKDSEPNLRECMSALAGLGYDARLILGDSTSPKVVDMATALGPFDAIFIDGNHSMPFVRLDYMNYGGLSRIVAFHDIGDPKMEVRAYWNGLKTEYGWEEMIANPGEYGIGVLWRS